MISIRFLGVLLKRNNFLFCMTCIIYLYIKDKLPLKPLESVNRRSFNPITFDMNLCTFILMASTHLWHLSKCTEGHKLEEQHRRPRLKLIKNCVEPGMVALTYDDGISDHVLDLLKILKSEGVQATFFVLGQRIDRTWYCWRKNRKALKNIWLAGHDVGSHSYSHPSFPSLSSEEIANQMIQTDDLLVKVLGVSPRIMRLPYGEHTDDILKQLHDMDYRMIQWNVDSDDWKLKDIPPPYLANHVAKMFRPRKQCPDDSYILIQHDIHQNTIANQVAIIRDLKAKGYKMVSMRKCLGTSNLYKRKIYLDEDEKSCTSKSVFESFE